MPEDFGGRGDIEVVRRGQPDATTENGNANAFRRAGDHVRLPRAASRGERPERAAGGAGTRSRRDRASGRGLLALARRGDPAPGGGVLVNDCWNANPVSMRAALEDLVERSEGRRTVAVLGEMAELGADSMPTTARSDRSSPRSASVLVAVGERARLYVEGAEGVLEVAIAPTRKRPLGSSRTSSNPATACSSRARGWSGSRSSPTRWPGSATRLSRRWYGSSSRASRPPHLDPHRTEADRLPSKRAYGLHIREEGLEHHIVKAGTPTLGRPAILRRALRRLPVALALHDERAARLLRHARLRGDRLPRRRHQAHAQALTRPQRPLEAPAARGHRPRRGLVTERRFRRLRTSRREP